MRDAEKGIHRHWLLVVGGALLVLAVAFWVSGAGIQAKATTTLRTRFTCPPTCRPTSVLS